MSKKNPKKQFTYTPARKLPKLGKIKTEWDLKKHYYTSEKDPQIEKDLKKIERAYEKFAKKYAKRDFTKTARALLHALRDYEKLTAMYQGAKVVRYFGFRVTLNASDSNALKQENLISARLTNVGNAVVFFELAIGKIPLTQQKKYLKDPTLSKYHYYLTSIFREARHLLSEPEEKILNLKSDVAHGLWISGTDTILNRRTITYKGESIPLPAAVDRVDTVPVKEKPRLWSTITDEFKTLAEIAENEMNAIALNKKINDELRGYKKPYSATIMAYENDERAVLALVDAISTKGFELSQRYYKLKAKLKGVQQFPYANRNDTLGEDMRVPYETAVKVCRDCFYSLDKKYGNAFDSMLCEGVIDVYPKKGKAGGAFCAGAINLPTYVMLNQVDNPRSLTTLAHEMGHAIHTERTKIQSPIYQGYSTTTAETASTFFEGIVQDRFVDALPPEERATMLDHKIGETIATVCRQIAFFNFEEELHETVRNDGAMTWQEIAALMQKHLNAYMGHAVSITPDDGLMFVYISHIRNFFYVYSYAYGNLMSNIMARRVYQDPSYIKQVDIFLTAGASNTVENIFKSIGIDATKTETFLESLKSLEEDINEFERLTKKQSRS